MDLIDFVFDHIASLIEYIKKLFVRVLNFVRNIKQFFLEPKRLRELKRNKDALAVVIKQKLESGNYKVHTCLFDKKTNKVIANEYGDIQEIEAARVDAQTGDSLEGELTILN